MEKTGRSRHLPSPVVGVVVAEVPKMASDAVAGPSQVHEQANGLQNQGPDLSTPSRIQARDAARTLRRRRVSGSVVRKAKAALEALDGTRHLDRRTWQAQYLAQAEMELVQALGGPDAVSPQQAAICRMAARTQLLLEQVDQYIQAPDGLGHPINRGKRALFPVVVQRQGLADALLKQLAAIGLERRARPVKRLADLLAEHAAQNPPAAGTAAGPVHAEVAPGGEVGP